MQKYKEKAKEIDIIDEVDVLVVGGGPAGIGAAVGARAGASVMIIQQWALSGNVDQRNGYNPCRIQ